MVSRQQRARRNGSGPHAVSGPVLARREIPVVVVLPPRTSLLDLGGPLEVLRRANFEQTAIYFNVRYVGATRSVST